MTQNIETGHTALKSQSMSGSLPPQVGFYPASTQAKRHFFSEGQ